MLTFDLGRTMLSPAETRLFDGHLAGIGADDSIWGIYDCLMRSGSKATTPLVLRAYSGTRLEGAAFIVRCAGFGKAFFRNPVFAAALSAARFPLYLWVKGLCADALSNPGFVRDPDEAGTVLAAMVRFLKEKCLCLCIIDGADNRDFYDGADILPYVASGHIDVSGMESVQDFTKGHRNLRHKTNAFRNRGGSLEIRKGAMDAECLAGVRKCIASIEPRSVVRSPFQDIYIPFALAISALRSENMVHFIARQNGEFSGYHSFVQSGEGLNLVHGAFDRGRESNNHAYEAMMTQTVDYAVGAGLKTIRYGPVFNLSKQRMMQRTEPAAYYLYSRIPPFGRFMAAVMKTSRFQSVGLLHFSRTSDTIPE